jgi:DNA modification methylase
MPRIVGLGAQEGTITYFWQLGTRLTAVPETFLNERISLHCGDCLDVLANLAENSIDSCVTDPPYHLTNIVKRFGSADAKAAQGPAFARISRGFMGKQWDGGDIAFRPDVWIQVLRVLKPGAHLLAFGGTRTYHRLACAIEDAGFEIRDCVSWLYGTGYPKNRSMRDIGRPELGTALKPAVELIVLARKPLSEGTVAQNVLVHGTGALNIDGCRIPTNETIEATRNVALGTAGSGIYGAANVPGIYVQKEGGRWPANVCHDGSPEVVAAFPETGEASDRPRNNGNFKSPAKGYEYAHTTFGHADNGGSAARFFYCAKASTKERNGSKHPTVKPVALMRWLIRLVTPPKGIVLDLFAGTGTTGEAAFREGMNAILIERGAEYQDDIHRRMKLVFAGPDERQRESIKQRTKDKPADHGPLFEAVSHGLCDQNSG